MKQDAMTEATLTRLKIVTAVQLFSVLSLIPVLWIVDTYLELKPPALSFPPLILPALGVAAAVASLVARKALMAKVPEARTDDERLQRLMVAGIVPQALAEGCALMGVVGYFLGTGHGAPEIAIGIAAALILLYRPQPDQN
ncbi:MAG: hypothetical protein HYV63_23360 [Candidatus Schekmanbacteria bacterium]|nr:hypothetical protein [Candidatus Schekmanbacteria bacterium]